MSSAFNSVDYFVIFVFALSMLAGFMRGLLKEVISLITWVSASAVSTLFASKLASYFGGSAAPTANLAVGAVQGATQGNYTNMIALAISFVVLFTVTLFAGYIVNTVVVGVMQGSFLSLPNRILGAVFGSIRGFIIVVVLLFVAELTPMGAQPAWGESHMVKAFAPTVKWLKNLVQPGLDMIRTKAEGALQGIQGGVPSSVSGFQGIIGGAVGGAIAPGGASAPAGGSDPYSSSSGN